MSGIYGYVSKNEITEDAVLNALDYWHKDYGKHANFHKRFSDAAVGCRLNIIKEDVNSDMQVLFEKNRYYGVFDALLYNREELLSKIDGYMSDVTYEELQKISDERLLFLVYLEQGEKGLREVNGDFSGAIYDIEERKLTVFRDHLGVRPLFVYEDESIFAFATDYRGFLAMPGANTDLNEPYLYEQFAGNNVREDELTYFKCITAVPPAHVIHFLRDGELKRKTRYWKLGEKKVRFKTEKEYIDEMRRLVIDSINRRLAVCKGPVGGELSGGLDSTVIDVLIHKTGRESYFCSWSPDLKLFPLQNLDERKNIQETCEKFGMYCHYLESKENGQSIIDYLEAIFPVDMDSAPIQNSMRYFKENGAQIAFTGWGGDEGVSHRSNPLELLMHGEYLAYLKFWWERTRDEKMSFLRCGKRVLKNLIVDSKKLLKPWNTFEVNHVDKVSFLNPSFANQVKGKLKTIPVYAPIDPIKQIEYGGNRKREEIVAVCGAIHGVQYLFPFLDYRVEDYAVSIPRRLYLKGGRNRYIYREAFKTEMTERLYCYQNKHDPGRGNYRQGEKNAIYIHTVSEYVLKRLDRDYWSRYLDFGMIESMLKSPDLVNKEEFHVLYLTRVLMNCYQIDILQRIGNNFEK